MACARWRWLAGAVGLAAALALAGCALPDHTFVVTTTADGTDAAPGDGVCEVTAGGGDCSLRAAVQEANAAWAAAAESSAIDLAPGATYELAVAGASEDAGATGDLDVTGDLTIDGNGATVDARQLDRVLDVRRNASLRLRETTITGGLADTGGGIRIDVVTTVEVSGSTITANTANGSAGVRYNWLGSTPVGGPGGGGGIANDGTLSMSTSTISDNTTSATGGCFPYLNATECRWHHGGGLLNNGTAGLIGVTISGNHADRGFGAAIASGLDAQTTVLHGTIAANSTSMVGFGGPYQGIDQSLASSIWAPFEPLRGTLTLGASIIAGDGALCSPDAAPTSQGHNLGEDSTCLGAGAQPTDRTSTPAGLTVLGDHGGPTATHLPGSPAIDAVPAGSVLCGALNDDQRGAARLVGTGCDIGAVERSAADHAPLTIVTSVPGGEVTHPYRGVVVASGGTIPLSLSLAGPLPDGLTWDPARGEITGVPTEAGTFPITFTATDANGSAQQPMDLVVIPAVPLEITSGAVLPAQVDEPTDAVLDATGGFAPYTWSLVGDLPAGLVWDAATATIAGTPTEAGSFPITATVTDAIGDTADLLVTILVSPAGPPEITRLPGLSARVGQAYNSGGLGAVGGVAPYSFGISPGMPPGLLLDPLTGVVSGTPTAAGTFPLVGTVTDSRGLSTSRSFTMTVQPAQALTIATRQLPSTGIGRPYSAAYTASGGLRPFTWSVLGGLPDGLAIDPSSGVLGGTPTEVGTWTISVVVTDALATTSVMPQVLVTTEPASFTSIVAGDRRTCGLVDDGGVQCWGYRYLGSGAAGSSAVPVPVTGITDAVAVTLGADHGCVLLADTTVRCWGLNLNGQVGDGTTTTRLAPVPVTGLTGVTQIAAGDHFTCATLTDGGVRCWGSNGFRQLGVGSTPGYSATPVSPVGLDEVVAVDAGANHTCALRLDATVRCWGANGSGQLASTPGGSGNPRPVPDLTTATSIAAGGDSTCAILADATARCWGRNDSGQLGDGTAQDRTTPTAVSGLTTVTDLSVGRLHTCATTSDGSIRCWGDGSHGKLGRGSLVSSSLPVVVSGLSGSAEVTAGVDHTCVRTGSGALWCWGRNGGAYGDGTTEPTSYVPVFIPGPGAT